ncbi:conserved hypothetical protein [Desulfatibacillum aliphaticivorans]|uniref:DUF7973 domain-containing protein n=1 Tax=Desulfatibacillum aliphaticivorans TaxID=218208 RepID=B8FDP2_DESAL|nr:hypothetical protein [Desulfatibacillum aliphaticivorans]ACL06673.1 conserved hypothetical protein [Desulfatibacillum aliphaticivorans]
MDFLVLLLVGFGGGVVGACIGALPAFILTGIFAVIGGFFAMLGQPVDVLGPLAFGPALGPHVFFVGGVAATAYAGKKGYIEEGGNILLSLNGTGEPSVMLVGGVFGVIGLLITTGLSKIGVPTDNIAVSVFACGVLGRLIFGEKGVCGMYNESEKRAYMSLGKPFWYNIILGFCVGLMWAGLVAVVKTNTTANITPIFALAFGFSAISLIFTQTGFDTPATHHIAYPSALAAAMAMNAGLPPVGGILVGGAFAALGALFGDMAIKIFNTNCDTHIDPPATAIALNVLLINLVL